MFNVTAWWAEPGNSDKGSTRAAHWGMLVVVGTSDLLWSGTTFGGATPGDPLTASAQQMQIDTCVHIKAQGWVDRCILYDNMVNSLGWYQSHRERMLDEASWPYFNRITSASEGLANFSGAPFMEVDGALTPCWLQGPEKVPVCWPLADIRMPCFFRGDCNTTANGASFGFYYNYSSPGTSDWRVADTVAFVTAGGPGGADGLFTDEMEMFPGDAGDDVLRWVGTTEADAQAQQAAGQLLHQRMIDALVADGKYMWHAFQAGNDIGPNTNNNTIGGVAIDAAYCAQWMAQRCNTGWVNERAITVQFDPFHVNVSVASFLVVRPAYAWLGYGAGVWTPRWNDACRWATARRRRPACSSASGPTGRRTWTAIRIRRRCPATRRIRAAASRRTLRHFRQAPWAAGRPRTTAREDLDTSAAPGRACARAPRLSPHHRHTSARARARAHAHATLSGRAASTSRLRTSSTSTSKRASGSARATPTATTSRGSCLPALAGARFSPTVASNARQHSAGTGTRPTSIWTARRVSRGSRRPATRCPSSPAPRDASGRAGGGNSVEAARAGWPRRAGRGVHAHPALHTLPRKRTRRLPQRAARPRSQARLQ